MSDNISPELLDFLDKFIDRQSVANMDVAQKLATIDTNMANTAVEVKDIADEFHNGFRSELKTHLDNHIKNVGSKLGEIDEKLKKLTSLSFWIRSLALTIGGIAAIIAGIIQLTK